MPLAAGCRLWVLPGCSWLLPGCSRAALAAPWLLLGCSLAAPWLLLAAPGCSLAAPGPPWLLHGCSWLLLVRSLAAPWLLPSLPGCSLAAPSFLAALSTSRLYLRRSGRWPTPCQHLCTVRHARVMSAGCCPVRMRKACCSLAALAIPWLRPGFPGCSLLHWLLPGGS